MSGPGGMLVESLRWLLRPALPLASPRGPSRRHVYGEDRGLWVLNIR
jgi:hypothetical protein